MELIVLFVYEKNTAVHFEKNVKTDFVADIEQSLTWFQFYFKKVWSLSLESLGSQCLPWH